MFSMKKAVGPHGIPSKFWRNIRGFFLPLALAINISFKTGISPELFQIAHVVPVYKKGDQLQ